MSTEAEGAKPNAAQRLAILALLASIAWLGAGGPAQEARAADSSELLESCLSAALTRPNVAYPLREIHAGIWPNTGFHFEQAVVGAFNYRAMPEDCAERYARVSGGDVQILRKGRWVTTRFGAVGMAGPEGRTAQVNTYGGHPDTPAAIPAYNTCHSGGRFHRVRVRMINTLTRPALGTTEGTREWTYLVTVYGSCSAAAISAKRVHKLQHEWFGTPLIYEPEGGDRLNASIFSHPRTSSVEELSATCLQAGTAAPRTLDGGPWLNHPGDRKTQNFSVEARYRALPKGCAERYRRKPEVQFQVQSPEKHSQWIDAGGYLSPTKTRDVQEEELEALEQEREEEGKSCWKPIPGGEKNVCRIEIHIGSDGGVAEAFFSPPRRLHEPSYSRHDPRVFRCTPGKGVTHVRVLFKNSVIDSNTGKILGQRVTSVPVRVRHYPGSGPMTNAWRGAVRGPC